MNNIISVVVPAYNESSVIVAFHARITAVMEPMNYDYEIVYVDDGSSDDTLSRLNQLRDKDPKVSIVDLSRNFGKK